MLDHRHPAVVGGLLVRQLARRIRGELVDVAELDLLIFLLFRIDGRAHERRRRAPARHHRLLRVARELEIGVGRQRRGAGIGDVEGRVDDVAAAMKRQHLHDLVAVGGGGGELQFHAVRAGREFAVARQRFVQRAMVGQPFAQQAGLRDAGALGIALQRQIRLGRVVAVAMLVERDQRNDAARRIDFGGVQVGANRDRLALGRGLGLPRHGSGRRHCRRRRCRRKAPREDPSPAPRSGRQRARLAASAAGPACAPSATPPTAGRTRTRRR